MLSNPIELAHRLFNIDLDEKPEFYCCVISKNDIWSTNRYVPVISMKTICELFSKQPLYNVFHIIRNKEYIKPISEQAKFEYLPIAYAGYIIHLSAFAFDKEREIMTEY